MTKMLSSIVCSNLQCTLRIILPMCSFVSFSMLCICDVWKTNYAVEEKKPWFHLVCRVWLNDVSLFLKWSQLPDSRHSNFTSKSLNWKQNHFENIHLSYCILLYLIICVMIGHLLSSKMYSLNITKVVSYPKILQISATECVSSVVCPILSV